METKNKKEVVSYLIETHDFNSGVPEDNYWDEIDCKGSLDEAKAEYEKQLATHDTLRLVRETRTIIKQSCKASELPKFISEIEQSLDEVSKRVHDCLLSIEDQLTILKAITKNW